MTPSPRDRLEAILAGAARRERDRRLVTGLTVFGLLLAILGALVAAWPLIGPRVGAPADLAGAVARARPLLVLLPILVVVVSLLPGLQRVRLARRLDRIGGLEDRVTTAAALVAGRTTARLGEHVIADAARAVAADPRLLDLAFPRRPRPLALRILRVTAGALVVLVLVAGISALLPPLPGPGGAGESGDGPGTAPPPPPGSPGGSGSGGGGARDPESGADEDDANADDTDDATATTPRPRPTEDATEDDATRPPPAEVGLSLLGGPFRVGRRILMSVRARPAAGLAADASFELEIVVDATPLRTGARMALGPGRPDGASRVVIVTDLPGAGAVLGAGDHVAVAMLTHPDGRTVVSAPVPFRIDADMSDDGASGAAPPPPGSDGADPEPPPEQPSAPDGGETGGEPPPSPDVPEPEVTDRAVVVPLFGDDAETVKKTGPRLVLTSGQPVREDAPDPAAIDEAVRRAEAAVDRAALSAQDRVLVIRYLDALRARAAARDEQPR